MSDETFYIYTLEDQDNPVAVQIPIERHDHEQAAFDAAKQWLAARGIGHAGGKKAARAELIEHLGALQGVDG